MSDYPYAPSLELYREWQREANHNEPIFLQVAAMAAQWGADQELEACCEWIAGYPGLEHPDLLIEHLRTARRPRITETQ
jgi:hypothetical protein